jgi:hypothetical protein
VVTPLAPSSEPGGNAAYVARDTVGGGLFGRRGDGELGVSVDAARSRSALPVSRGLTDPVPEDPAYSLVFHLRRSFRTSESFAIGLAGDVGWLRVPILLGGQDREQDSAGIFRAAIIPSWRSGALAVFGGLHLTNDFEVPATTTIDEDHSSEAFASGYAAFATAGASVELGGGLKLATQVAKPFASTTPHGVQVDVVLGIELGAPAAAR